MTTVASGTSTNTADGGAKAAFLSYVSRNNEVQLDDRSTIDAVLELTVEPQTQVDREYLVGLADRGWRMEGESAATFVGIVSDSATDGESALDVCIDVSKVRYFDDTGTERDLKSAPGIQQLRVVMSETAPRIWRVKNVSPRSEGEPCSAEQ